MAHKFDVKNKHKLDSEERRRILPPHETLIKAGLKPGDTVADVGCGIGYFTVPAAGIVGPTGKVYAMDISPEMLIEVEKKKTEMPLANITTVLTEEDNLKIADNSVTFVFLCNVLHEVENTANLLSEANRILANDGRIAILEWEKIESNFGPPLNHRLAREYVIQLLQDSGFKNVQAVDLGEHFYAVSAENE